MLKPAPPGNEHHQQDARSRPIHRDLLDGMYVYVMDEFGTVWVLPDEHAHQHVKILGGTVAVQYAGDMEIQCGIVKSVTNCSGTFQFNEREGLLEVARQLRLAGITVEVGAVCYFDWDRSAPCEILG